MKGPKTRARASEDWRRLDRQNLRDFVGYTEEEAVGQIWEAANTMGLELVCNNASYPLRLALRYHNQQSAPISLNGGGAQNLVSVVQFLAMLHATAPNLEQAMQPESWAMMPNEQWAEMAADIQRKAEAAGGSIEFYGREKVRYYRCARLKLRSMFSPILGSRPYHSGQNHRFWFSLPEDWELLSRFIEHDAKLYEKLFAKPETPETLS